MSDEVWWDEYFDEAFVRLYEPLLPEEATLEEVEAIIDMLELPVGSDILDLACGWGRHAVPLGERGFRVCGLDRSEYLLRRGARTAAREGVEIGWVRGDVRALPWSSAFDAVVSLFSSLGYFGSDEEDLRALQAVRQALRPNGVFLLDTMHRDQIAREYVERDWWEGGKGEHVWVEREFDAVTGVSREWLRWRKGRRSGEKFHEIRVRSATEWDALLRAAHLEPEAWYGGWDQSPFRVGSERLVAIARPSG